MSRKNKTIFSCLKLTPNNGKHQHNPCSSSSRESVLAPLLWSLYEVKVFDPEKFSNLNYFSALESLNLPPSVSLNLNVLKLKLSCCCWFNAIQFCVLWRVKKIVWRQFDITLTFEFWNVVIPIYEVNSWAFKFISVKIT